MPKFFVVSDVHGFYNEMISALNEAGYDPNDENHWIISCGDHFDRGTQASEMYDWLVNTQRLIPILGNHERLLYDMLYRGYGESHDISNGTVDTVNQLYDKFAGDDYYANMVDKCRIVRPYYKSIYDNLNLYFETKNYIFVHAWIPMYDKAELPAHYRRGHTYNYRYTWRDASFSDWNNAVWINGFNAGADGLNQTGKIIVFGHWHASYGRLRDSVWYNEFGPDADFSPYYGQNYIGIDACTAHTHKVNVLVIEDEWNDET